MMSVELIDSGERAIVAARYEFPIDLIMAYWCC